MEKKEKPTLKDRIHEAVAKFDVEHQERFEQEIFELIERITHPYYFCPDCGERMFYEVEQRYYKCINCGYNSLQAAQPSTTRGQLPKEIENVIKEAEAPVREVKVTSKGVSIQKLAERARGGSVSAPTREDEALIRGADPRVKGDINWS
jgi:hypothetical protein